MPLRLQFQLNVRTVHPDFVGTHSLRRRRAEHLAGADLELGTVPGASDLVVLEFPLRERAAAMRTGIVDGVELTVQVEQRDLLSLHLNQFPVVRFKLARLPYFDIFGHANLLDHSTNPAARCRGPTKRSEAGRAFSYLPSCIARRTTTPKPKRKLCCQSLRFGVVPPAAKCSADPDACGSEHNQLEKRGWRTTDRDLRPRHRPEPWQTRSRQQGYRRKAWRSVLPRRRIEDVQTKWFSCCAR